VQALLADRHAASKQLRRGVGQGGLLGDKQVTASDREACGMLGNQQTLNKAQEHLPTTTNRLQARVDNQPSMK
jgi:hypothetical protein